MIKHASSLIKCVDGSWRGYGTLCGLIAYVTAPQHPDAVTCKACRRSRSWPAFVQSLRDAGQLS